MWSELLASAIGAAIGAAATVGTGLYLAKQARDEEEKTSSNLLHDALVRFIEAIHPLVVLTHGEIDRRDLSGLLQEVREAHEQFQRVNQLLDHLLDRDRGFSAKALLGIFGIFGTLEAERALWEHERRAILNEHATKRVLKIHIDELRESAIRMDRHAEEAIVSLGRKRPIIARAAEQNLDDVVASSAATTTNPPIGKRLGHHS